MPEDDTSQGSFRASYADILFVGSFSNMRVIIFFAPSDTPFQSSVSREYLYGISNDQRDNHTFIFADYFPVAARFMISSSSSPLKGG